MVLKVLRVMRVYEGCEGKYLTYYMHLYYALYYASIIDFAL